MLKEKEEFLSRIAKITVKMNSLSCFILIWFLLRKTNMFGVLGSGLLETI